MTGNIRVVYVTCASREEALRIGREAVARRLAACVNLHPHEAIYRWRGVVEEAAEYALILKTTTETYPALAALVRRLHSAELPCIIAWPIAEGDADYCRWIAENVGEEGGG